MRAGSWSGIQKTGVRMGTGGGILNASLGGENWSFRTQLRDRLEAYPTLLSGI
jgi:hypothetical protein